MTEAAAIAPPAPLDEGAARRFRAEGILVLRGLLDPGAELRRLRESYVSLVDSLGRTLLREVDSPLVEGFDARPFPERFAVALGASGGALLDHLDPVLRVGARDYRHRAELPSAQIPELFELARAPRLLDALQCLLGPELEASPIYHLTFKLGRRHLELARAAAEASRQPFVRPGSFDTFHVLQTGWHMDAAYGLPDAHASSIAIAWMPLTGSREANGCLRAIPGSHLHGVRAAPFDPEELARGVSLEVGPGDVILLDHKTLHASSPNRTDDDFRWAFSFRYAPIGQPTGRPYLPGFVARSGADPAAELRSAEVWSAMWRAALGHATRHRRSIPRAGKTTPQEAEAITRRWRERTPDPQAWLALDPLAARA